MAPIKLANLGLTCRMVVVVMHTEHAMHFWLCVTETCE